MPKPVIHAGQTRYRSPIAQRCALYGYAYVQLLPLGDWITPWLPATVRRSRERRRITVFDSWLDRLGIVRLTGPGPILSYHLSTLVRERRRHPSRPLILIQPLFQSPYAPSRLCKLRATRTNLHDLLWEHDDAYPLVFGPPSPESPQVRTYDPPDHPLRDLWQRRDQWADQCSLDLRDDGRIECQLHLFARQNRLPSIDPDDQSRLDSYAHRFISSLPLPATVLARSRASQAWFARDCLRVLGPYFPCAFIRECEHPPTGVGLVCDGDIRYEANLQHQTWVYLDRGPRRHLYRLHRLAQANTHTWLSAPVLDQTQRHWSGRVWTFHRTAQGWRSMLTAG